MISLFGALSVATTASGAALFLNDQSSDTTVAVNDSFCIHAADTDANGTIAKSLWALDGTAFNDSTDRGAVSVAFAATGFKTVLVKVRQMARIAVKCPLWPTLGSGESRQTGRSRHKTRYQKQLPAFGRELASGRFCSLFHLPRPSAATKYGR
ncbi:MAG: hypothetical protein ABSH28_02115 [Acidobacteriota bacterium]